jgi:hypothetical protein
VTVYFIDGSMTLHCPKPLPRKAFQSSEETPFYRILEICHTLSGLRVGTKMGTNFEGGFLDQPESIIRNGRALNPNQTEPSPGMDDTDHALFPRFSAELVACLL